jgi:hypothetical protein
MDVFSNAYNSMFYTNYTAALGSKFWEGSFDLGEEAWSYILYTIGWATHVKNFRKFF